MSWLMILAMTVAMLPALSLPARAGIVQVYVNGVNIVADADHTVPCGAGTAVFDLAAATLTLTDAVIDTSYATGDNKYGIYSFSNLTITLSGTNTVIAEDAVSLSCGIHAGGNLTFNGTGSLSATGGQAITSYGISATGTLTLTEGLVAASSVASSTATTRQALSAAPQNSGIGTSALSGAYNDMFAVYGDGGTFMATSTAVDCSFLPTLPTGATWDSGTNTLTLDNVIINTPDNAGDYFAIKLPDGANLVLSGTNVIHNGNQIGNGSTAIGAIGSLNISGSGSLYALGGAVMGVGYASNGISTWGATTIASGAGHITAIGSSSASGHSLGISADSLTIQGGAVSAAGSYCAGPGSADSRGISTESSMNLNGGTVTVIGGTSVNANSYGLYANGALTVSGGTVTAKSGTAAESRAVNANSGITVNAGLGIAVPVGGALYDSNRTIVPNGSSTPATSVAFGAPPSSVATLTTASTVKGATVASLGTPADSIAGITSAGTVTLTAAQAGDTTNNSPYVTNFVKTESHATIKAVKYASGGDTSNFATDTAYDNGALSDGDFFIIKITAQDGTTINYYRINLAGPTVTPSFASATATKAAAYQQSVTYTLNTALTGTWKVYAAASGGAALPDVTAAASGTTLTLSSTGADIAERNYWITLTETGKGESARVQATVDPAADVVLVGNETDLAGLATDVNDGDDYSGKTVKQTADITLTGTWTPIGTSSGNHPFKGTYDGNGHAVSGLNVSAAPAESGLFGLVVDATIKNLVISAPTVSGAGWTGALAGEADTTPGNTSTIENVAVVGGTVTSSNNYIGGLIGQTSSAGTFTISGCYTTCNVSGTTHVGGIVGNFTSVGNTSRIENCYTLGNITASGGFAGGIVGYAYYTNAASVEQIVNVFSTGTITATYDGAGIVGNAYGNTSGSCTIDHAAALNKAVVNSSAGTNDGTFQRIAGEIYTGTTLSNCYAWKNMTVIDSNTYVDDTTPAVTAALNDTNGLGITKSAVNQAASWLTYLNVANGSEGYGKWTNGTHKLPNLTALSSDDNIAMPDHLAYKALNSDSAATRSYTAGDTTGIYIDSQIEVYGPNFSGAKVIITGYGAATDTVTWNLTGTGITVQQSGGQDIAVEATTAAITFTGTDTAEHYQQVLRSVHLVTTATAGSRSISFSLGESAAYNGHYYEFVAFTAGTQKTWEQAKDAASRMEFGGQAGYLATIQTAEENAFIASKLGANGWIGAKGTMNGAVKEWKWVTDPDLAVANAVFYTQTGAGTGDAASGAYINFNSGEPNGAMHVPANLTDDTTEWCGEIYSGGSNPGKWNDLKNTGYASNANLTNTASLEAKGYVVEYNVVPAEFVVTKTVNITAQSSGGGSGGSGGTAAPIAQVNGQPTVSGTVETTTSGGVTTTTVTVNQSSLSDQLLQAGSGAVVTIPFTQSSDAAIGRLNGQMVKAMENNIATLVIQTPTATYTLPANQINISAVSQQFGANITLSDIAVSVSISAPSDQTVQVVQQAADDNGLALVVPAVNFEISCTYNGVTVDVSQFNAYVERMIAIPDGVDPSKITTGVVVEPDGTARHVPTRIAVIDGVYYAVINSLTNSTYSVVWHPFEFIDVDGNWAKISINNMGSRMVVSGVGEGVYEPDRNMTRAEFAAIIVKALGLKPGLGTKNFNDVRSGDWFAGYVKTAAEYGIITGYSNGNFGPESSITREQAMTMIARAMKITKLEAGLSSAEISALLAKFTDSGSISSYAQSSIAECVKAGVVTGRTATTIAPIANITRAEVAVIVERLLQKSDLIDS